MTPSASGPGPPGAPHVGVLSRRARGAVIRIRLTQPHRDTARRERLRDVDVRLCDRALEAFVVERVLERGPVVAQARTEGALGRTRHDGDFVPCRQLGPERATPAVVVVTAHRDRHHAHDGEHRQGRSYLDRHCYAPVGGWASASRVCASIRPTSSASTLPTPRQPRASEATRGPAERSDGRCPRSAAGPRRAKRWPVSAKRCRPRRAKRWLVSAKRCRPRRAKRWLLSAKRCRPPPSEAMAVVREALEVDSPLEGRGAASCAAGREARGPP